MTFFEKFGRSAGELRSVRCLTVTAVLIALDIVIKGLLTVPISNSLKISFAFIALSTIGMLYGPSVGFIAGIITDIVGFLVKPTGDFNPMFTIIEAIGGMLYGIFLYDISKQNNNSIEKEKSGSFISVLGKGALTGVLISEIFGLIFCVLAYLFRPYLYAEGTMNKVAKIFYEVPLLFTFLLVGFVYGVFFSLLLYLSGRKLRVKNVFSIVLSKASVVIICNLILTPCAQVLSSQKMTWETMLAGYPTRLVKQMIEYPVDCIIMLVVLFPILYAYKRVFERNAAGSDRSKEEL